MPKPRSKTKVTSADAVPPLSLAQVSPRGTSSTVSPRGSGAQVSPRNAQVSPRNAQVSPRNAATQQVSPRGAQQSPRTTSASPRGSADAVSPRSSGGEVPSEADVGADGKPRCHMCGTDSTPQWRRTLDGKGHAPLLCNSCGLKERRAKKRLEEAMREGRVRDDGTIERRAATRDDDSSSKKSKSPPARNKTRSRTGPIANVASVIATPGSSASSSAATSPRGHEFSCSNPVYSGPEPISVGPRSTSGRRAAVAAAAAIAANVGSTSPSSSTSAPAVPPPPPPFMLTGFGVLQDHSLGLVPPPPPLEAALLMPRANATAGAPPMRALASSQGALLTMLKQEKQETPMSPALTSPKRRRRLNAEGDSGRAPEESEDDNKHR